jgi:dihydroxyacetone synthase
MASISNGLVAYSKGTILPVTSSFFMFYMVRSLSFLPSFTSLD